MRFSILLFLILPGLNLAQDWVTMQYDIETQHDILYGISVDFAGKEDSLLLDLSYPIDDEPPICGRPLMVFVHGGAWLGGDKSEGYASRFREDFASRGYVVASVNYRLGMFHTDRFINCNVPDWNCLNMTDSSEWYRANFRAIQDVKGAIRFLAGQKSLYQINTDNVFISGESAGAFIAMGAAYLEDNEVLSNLTGSLPDAPRPNMLYENNCIRQLGLAGSIDEMELDRPALGAVDDGLYPAYRDSFQIRAVGNFYGGVFHNFFASQSTPPPLYLFHQPCDLIVPFNRSKLLAGFNACYSGFPANCGSIINRPVVMGGAAIADTLDIMKQRGENVPEYQFESTSFNYNCLQQAANPAIACHSIDNYPIRSNSMASFFSRYIGDCLVGYRKEKEAFHFEVYPNPSDGLVRIKSNKTLKGVEVRMYNAVGIFLKDYKFSALSETQLDLSSMQKGLYFFKIMDVNNPVKYEVVSLIIE